MKKILLTALIGLIAASASAATLQVKHNPGAGQYGTIAAAVEAAASGDTIEIIGDATPFDEGIVNPFRDKALNFIGTKNPMPIFQNKNISRNNPFDDGMYSLFVSATTTTVENIHFVVNNPISGREEGQPGGSYPFDMRHNPIHENPVVIKNCKLESPEYSENTVIAHDRKVLFEGCELEFGGQIWQLWEDSTTFKNCKITSNKAQASQKSQLAITFGGQVTFDNCYVDFSHQGDINPDTQLPGGTYVLDNRQGLIEIINGTLFKVGPYSLGVNNFNYGYGATDAHRRNEGLHGIRIDHSIFGYYGVTNPDVNGVTMDNKPEMSSIGYDVRTVITNSDMIGGWEGKNHPQRAASGVYSGGSLWTSDDTPAISINNSVFYDWGFFVGFHQQAGQEADVMVEAEQNAIYTNVFTNTSDSNAVMDPSNKLFDNATYPLSSTFVYVDTLTDNFYLHPSSEAAKMSPIPGSKGVASETDLPAWPMEAVKIASGGTAPVIDGVINTAEWARATPIDLRLGTLNIKDPYKPEYTHKGSAYYTATATSGTIVNDADCSAMIYYMWDDDAFYIAASVKDDVNRAVANSETTKVNGGDCFQLCIDYDNIRADTTTAPDQIGFVLIPSWAAIANRGSYPASADGLVSTINPNFYQFWPENIFDQPNQFAGMTWEVKMSGANYDLEARIPWNAFKVYNEAVEMPYKTTFPPKAGQICGVLPMIDDHDENDATSFLLTEFGPNGFPVGMPSSYSKMTFVLEGSVPSTNFARQWNTFE